MFIKTFFRFLVLSLSCSFVITLRCFQCSSSFSKNCNRMQRKEYCPSHTYECLTLTYSYEVDDGSQVLTKDVYQKKCVPRDANNCQSYCVTHRLLGAVYCKVQCCSRNLCNERKPTSQKKPRISSSCKQPFSFVLILTLLVMYCFLVHLLTFNS